MNRKHVFIILSIVFLLAAIGLSAATITGAVIGNAQGITFIGIICFLIGLVFFVASKVK